MSEPRPKSFLDEALKALNASRPEEDKTPGPDKIIYALHALTWACLAATEETSRT
jgi:hypothetical protein